MERRTPLFDCSINTEGTPHAAMRAVAPAPSTTPAAAPALAQAPAGQLAHQALRYQFDRWQRAILMLDTLRVRANNMLAHAEAGMPAPLEFEYETIADARHFARPANYALLRITRCHEDRAEECVDPNKPPVIIVDPRAGHGPGIGGSKRDSEVGMALHEGHATYFVIFFPLPCEGQTLADVLNALRQFVGEVSKRHGGRAPVLYGNCQAGWAVTLLAADCAGLTGPTVLNGSPLSYWAGASDANPMRLAGGLIGGSWLAHWLADLGNGRFDGAWLVQNFENLNPANTLWEKYYKVFANIDTERERFLDFERWWTGYHFLSREEILTIVENLFIGNQLERGVMKLCAGCYLDLKRIRNPLVIFASSGDNITPPHQALNWIPAIYPTTAALKAAGQRIVYLLNTHVGHLGIFVSAAVAKLEHRAILESLGELNDLAPGLYEMKISNPTGDPDCRKPQYAVHFEPREVDQIRYAYPAESFQRVQEVSARNERFYQTFVSPSVTAFANPFAAEMLKWMHPLRLGIAIFSEKLNPWMVPVSRLAQAVTVARAPVDDTNTFVGVERGVDHLIGEALDLYRKNRDAYHEQLFKAMYGTPVPSLLPAPAQPAPEQAERVAVSVETPT